jgi:hypothetical protein
MPTPQVCRGHRRCLYCSRRLSVRAGSFFESIGHYSYLTEHDHVGKPVSTFPDHALVMHENREQNDNRQRNADQPKQ